MAITTGNHPKFLWPGIKAIYDNAAEKPKQCTEIFDQQTSDKAYEERVEDTGFGLAAPKPEGSPVQYDTDQQGYVRTTRNVTYGIGAKVTMEAIQDNQYEPVAKKKARKLERSYRQTMEHVAANVLNRGFNASFKGGDGVELFSTAHPTLSGNQSNMLAVAADLSEASLEDLLTQIRDARDSRGLRFQLKGMKLILPPELEWDATRILESVQQPGTANNDVNAMRASGMLPGGMMVFDYLSDPDAFFIKTDADEGLIYQERMAAQLEQDHDFDTSNACMKVVGRYAFDWANWRGVYASAGA